MTDDYRKFRESLDVPGGFLENADALARAGLAEQTERHQHAHATSERLFAAEERLHDAAQNHPDELCTAALAYARAYHYAAIAEETHE